MEITMTITGNLEQMSQILTFAQNMGLANSTITQMRSNTQPTTPAMPQPNPVQIPTQPNPMQNNPFATVPQAIPQQVSVPAQQQGLPAAIPQSAPVQGNPIPQQTAPAAVPQSAPTYSIQDLTLAARPLMEMGKQAELAQLLAEFGVQAVAMLPENRRADFAARLRAMGGQI